MPDSTAATASGLNIKPPDFLSSKEEFPQYRRRLERWSRTCGTSKKLQGDIVLMYAGKSNIADMLDREIGDQLEDNEEGVKLIIDTLEGWYGKESNVDLYQSFVQWKDLKRLPGQDVVEFITKYEDSYTRLSQYGEKTSDRLKGMHLLQSADLPYLQHNLVLSAVNFADKDAKDHYDKVKESIRKYHASDEINKKTSTVLLASDKDFKTNLENISQEDLEKVLVSKGWKPPPKNQEEKRWWKCNICLCKCPKFQKCDCPCSHHKWYNCPDRKKKDKDEKDDKPKEISTMYCSLLDSTSTKKTFVVNLTKVFHSKQDLTSKYKFNGKETHFAIKDSACPSTMCGNKWLKTVYESYPSAVAAQFKSEKSDKVFEFGGGERAPSMGTVTFPCYIRDDKDNLHLISIKTEVVEADIVLLFGGNSLIKAEAVMDYKELSLAMPTLGEQVKIPMSYSKSGHFTFDLYAVTEAERQDAAQCLLVNKEWTQHSANKAICYVLKTKEAEVRMEPLTRDVKVDVKLDKRRLSLKDVEKLHHVFGHAGREKLTSLIKRADRWRPEIEDYFDNIKCEVCALESKLSPRPKIALPRAAQFNHILCIDLKENTKFPNCKPFIFYMVDMFTRFKMACFISNKKASTISEVLFTHWFKLFGPCNYLHSDRGREFINDEVMKLCELHGIRITNTAARTPNANGICEKQHWFVDKMMEKVHLVDPSCSPEILLGWCIHAANTLDNRGGHSPHELVFGKNPVHPSLANPNPTMSNETQFSKQLANNINLMYKAREAFVQCESDHAIREALKQRLYTRIEDIKLQDWIYFKENKNWFGPVRVVGIEGKRIHAMRAGRMLTINRDNIVISKSKEELEELGEDFVSIPLHLRKTDEEEGIFHESSKEESKEEKIEDIEIIESFEEIPQNDVQEEVGENDDGRADEENEDENVMQSECVNCHEVFPTDQIVDHNRVAHNVSGSVRKLSKVINTPNLKGHPQVFFTSVHDHNVEECFVTVLPRKEHNQPHATKAKIKELEQFLEFNVYDVVDAPANENIISTQWVIVQKEDDKDNLITKARLCIRGDLETNKHLIPTDSPTINKITLKIILTIAAARGWSFQTSDITRAFLQTEDLVRNVYVRPPPESGVPRGKVWKLKKCCYGLIDAGRSFFLKHSGELKKLGMETLKMDPACFLYFTDKSKPTSESREIKGIIGGHVDDNLEVGEKVLFDKVVNEMKNKFKYGSHNQLPFKFTGLNVTADQEGIRIDQDKYIDNLEIPNVKNIAHLTKDSILDPENQTIYRSITSKLNMLSITARPDICFDVKLLTSRYGKATKEDLLNVVKLIRKIKRDTTEIVIPNIGEKEDWILLGISDAATKKVNNLFSVSGQIVMLVNRKTNKASVLFWASKKIERVCSSSLAAETLALQKLFSTMFYIRQVLRQMFGKAADKIPGLALIDNQDLWSTIHHLKNCEDKRLLADIIQLKQAIIIDHTVQEVRFVKGTEMLSDCLTKPGRSAEALNIVLKSGEYQIPGGNDLRDSTKINVKTWRDLIEAETEDFNH